MDMIFSSQGCDGYRILYETPKDIELGASPTELDIIYQEALQKNRKELSECKEQIATAQKVKCCAKACAYGCPTFICCLGTTGAVGGLVSVGVGLGLNISALCALGAGLFALGGGWALVGCVVGKVCVTSVEMDEEDSEALKEMENLINLKKALKNQKKLLETEEFKKFTESHDCHKLSNLLTSYEFKKFANDLAECKKPIDREIAFSKLEEKFGYFFKEITYKKHHKIHVLEDLSGLNRDNIV